MGLGHRQQGIIEPITLNNSYLTHNLGYQPSQLELMAFHQMYKKRVLKKKEVMSSFYLNSRFIKAGEDFPYCGLCDLWYDLTEKKMKPGFEMFFEDKITWTEGSKHEVNPLTIKFFDSRSSDGKITESTNHEKSFGLTESGRIFSKYIRNLMNQTQLIGSFF